VDRFDLITKLAAVEALEGGAATDGERRAAGNARERLVARIAEDDAPMPRAFAEELEAGHHLRAAGSEGGGDVTPELPDRLELRLRIRACLDTRLAPGDLSRWAASWVDAAVLPDLPDADPGSVAPEVVLVLAAGPPSAPLCRAMLEFLDTDATDSAAGWRRWLEALAQLS
jgi:hypothetical protein